jgi:hypothetical protein
MNYQNYKSYLKISHYLSKEPEGEYGKIHRMFNEFWDGLTFTTIKDEIYLHKDGTVYAKILNTCRFIYTVENLNLSDYLVGKNRTNQENIFFFQKLINEHLSTNIITQFDWAYEWSLNDKLTLFMSSNNRGKQLEHDVHRI